MEVFRRWKFFVGGSFSSVEMFRRWKCFVGGNVSSVEMFRRWKFRHLTKFSSLSTDEIFTDKVYTFHMDNPLLFISIIHIAYIFRASVITLYYPIITLEI